MGNIVIPEEHVSGFNQLGTISELEYEELQNILQEAFPQSSTPRVPEILNKVATIPNTNLRVIIDALIGLISFRYQRNDPPKLFFEEFYSSLSGQLADHKSDLDIIVFRIKELYNNSESVRRAFKASNLLYESEHLYETSRVISDIRPMFHDEDPSEKCEYALIVHRLKIVRQDVDGVKEMYLSMTRGQLNDLKHSIERAIQKDDKIRSSDTFLFID